MADEPAPPPPPVPQNPEHQTLVLTDPPEEKHHTLLYALCVAAVALVTGGIIVAYWQFGGLTTEVVSEENTIANTPTDFTDEERASIITLLQSESDTEDKFGVSRPSRQYDSFYRFGVWVEGQDGGVEMITLKNSDGTFTRIWSGHDRPWCEQLEPYRVPHQIIEECLYTDENGKIEERTNTF